MEQLGIRHEVLPELRRSGALIGAVGAAGAAAHRDPDGYPDHRGDDGRLRVTTEFRCDIDWKLEQRTRHDPRPERNKQSVNSGSGRSGLFAPVARRSLAARRSVEFRRWRAGTFPSERRSRCARRGSIPATRSARTRLSPGIRARANGFPSSRARRRRVFFRRNSGRSRRYVSRDHIWPGRDRTTFCFDYLDMLGFPTHGRLSLTGGGSRSRFWNDRRATMLGRELVVPATAELAFGMAILASSPSKAARRRRRAAMVRIESRHEPQMQLIDSTLQAHLHMVVMLSRRADGRLRATAITCPTARYAMTDSAHQSGILRRGRHMPRITFAVATASNTQRVTDLAPSDAASVAASASWSRARAAEFLLPAASAPESPRNPTRIPVCPKRAWPRPSRRFDSQG